MHPIDENALRMTRRHFFGRSSTGAGIAALAGLLGAEERAGPRRACPGFRTFRRRRSASSICSSPAALRRWSCSTTSRA